MSSKSNPVVSVIIPTYNRAEYIKAAIASVLAQDFDDFEIIIIDDGSTDDTRGIVAAIADERIRYLPQENKGRSFARNVALRHATGRYIAFLDSDDCYLPGKLSLQVRYMDANPETGMVYTSAHCIDGTGNRLPAQYLATMSGRIYQAVAFFQPVTITLPTVMVRRALMAETGGFDEAMERFEDTDMWRRLSKRTMIDALPEFTCELRTHGDNQLASQNPKQIIAALNYYAQKIRQEDAAMGRVALRRGLGTLYYYYGRAFLSVQGWKMHSIGLLLRALWCWPPAVVSGFSRMLAR